MIRLLDKKELKQAITLSLEVFIQTGKADFNAEGLETFKSFINNKDLMNELCIYGAFDNDILIGLIGTKNEGKHISLFFIRQEYHRKGIGKQLFDFASHDKPVDEMTVNSSSYAIAFYQSLGFKKTCEEQDTNGLKYTPMKRNI
ncbi:GNAT family N-acetyltransferase [Phocaeicola sp.]